MRKTVIFILSLLWIFTSVGQSNETDSLHRVLKTTQEDSSRVSTLIALSGNYYRTNPQKAQDLAFEAVSLAEEAGYKPGLALAHKAVGMSYYFQNNWIDALIHWQRAKDVFEEVGDLAGVSNMLNNLGAVYFNEGDDEQAIKNYLNSLKVAEKSGDSLRIVTALINIGTVHLNKKSTHELAFKYYQRALPMSEKLGDYDAIGTCAVNMGEIYVSRGKSSDLDSALFYYEKALETYQESATGNLAFALKSIGKVYAERGEFDEAIKYQTEAYNFAKSVDGRLEMAQSLLSLAETYRKKGDLNNAIEAYQTAEELAVAIGALYEINSAYGGLADAYKGIGDYKQAFRYKELFSSLKDTLYNSETEKRLQAATLNYEIEKKQGEITLLQKDRELKEIELEREKTIRNGAALTGVLLLIVVAGLFHRYRYTHRTNKIIEKEKERSDELLLNILPHETAEELKLNGKATPKYYKNVSVLFTDFQGFTGIAEKLSPQELVEELNECFSAFDQIITKYGLEKIKTIGDSYMCASGIPTPIENNAFLMVKAALEIRDYMLTHHAKRLSEGHETWDLRIGVHTGPVIAGVVGKNKFAYDIWGDTVNTASRMETSGVSGEVNISGATYEQVKDHFICKHRGKIMAKNKGEVDMYLVEGFISNENAA
jgi:class 3 adenylate cyclase/Tfp pilus assembly protein PilF